MNVNATIQSEDDFSDPDEPIAPFEESLEDDLSDENAPLTISHEEENAQETSTMTISKRHRTLFVRDDDDEDEEI